MNETKTLAEFSADLTFEDLPGEVVGQAKTCLLDLLGAVPYGSTMPWGQIIRDYVLDSGGKEESTVIASASKVPAPNAALANGTMGHGFELDDHHMKGMVHTAVTVIPAALAAGERVHATGKALITAIVVGYDVAARIGQAVTKELSIVGWHTTATTGPFGAAAAAGNILKLSGDQMVNALGLAGSQSAGTHEFYKEGPMSKRFHAGRASQSGVISALLAQRGFTAPSTMIEGKYGYLKLYTPKYDLAPLTKHLGEKFEIMGTRFKPYSMCGGLHAPFEATLKIVRREQIKPQEVKRIVVGGLEKHVCQHMIYEPEAVMGAQYSLPYAVALAFLYGRAGPDEFREEILKDEGLRSLASKVEAVADLEVEENFPEHRAARVTVTLMDGREFTDFVLDASGSPQNPLSPEELKSKFVNLASRVFPKEKAMKILGTVEKLEKLNDINELTKHLSSS